MSGREQVALLTRGIALPLPPISPVLLMVIADAICQAWEQVVAHWPATAAEDPELEVNSALITCLTVALRQRSEFSTIVSEVVRGSEQYNYNGDKFEKRPDINIYFTDRARCFPLHCECKIIHLARRRSVRDYRDNGVNRFTTGDYGWTSAEGLMVAYVRDATEAVTALAAVVGPPPPTRWSTQTRTHHCSRHDRGFQYVDRDPITESPGEIALYHLWLEADEAELA